MFHYTKAVLKVGLNIAFSSFTWMRKYAKENNKDIDFNKRYKKLSKFVNKISKALQADFIIDGLENIPSDNNFFLAPNHLSDYDPLAILSILDKPSTFVAKKEIENFPFIGLAVKDIDGLFLDRSDIKASLKSMLYVENDLLKKEKSWIIFPEGTRNKDNMILMKEFHHGTFRAPMRSKTIIIPVAIYGTFRILKFKPQFKKYPIFIKFLPPIYPEQYKDLSTQEMAIVVQNEIQKTISFELRQKDHEYMLKQKNKKYRFNRTY